MTGRTLARTGRPCPVAPGRIAAPSWVGAAQPRATCLGGLQCGFGALADHLALVLGDGREDVDSEPVGLRHVHRRQIPPPHSIRPLMKWTLRASRSSLAISSTALCLRQASRAAASCGRSFLRPLSISIKRSRVSSPCPCRKTFTACCWAASPRPLWPWRLGWRRGNMRYGGVFMAEDSRNGKRNNLQTSFVTYTPCTGQPKRKYFPAYWRVKGRYLP